MKWKKKSELRPKKEERVIRVFLLFPRCIGGECRVWEWASIKQKHIPPLGPSDFGLWVDIAWVDE